ncbi:MAG: TetR/AcrR family transcriptional regulator [Eubacterium sp.]
MTQKVLICFSRSSMPSNFLIKSVYEVGFKKTTMRSIAEEAGMNQGLIYYYFKSKYDLAHYIIDDHFYRASTLFRKYLNPDDDLFLFTLELIRAVLREVYCNPKDLELYLHAYEKPYCDWSQVEYCILICQEHGISIDQKTAEMAVLLAWVWGMTGVWCVFPVTELMVALIGGMLYIRAKRREALF